MPYKDPAANKACIKNWVERNRDKTREYQRRWKAKNVEKVRAKAREWGRRKVALFGPAHVMLTHAKRRAKARGVPCTIRTEDIRIPSACPVFGIPLKINKGVVGKDSPTLDCVVPSRGYVAGNIRVISHLANRLKGDMTLDQLKALVAYVEVAGAH